METTKVKKSKKHTKNSKSKSDLELLFDLMLKKAALKPEDIYTISMKLWIMDHADDLLSPEEKNRFKHLFA